MTDVIAPTITEVNLTKDITTGEKFLNNYKLVSKLGSGHNGKVYLGKDVDDDKLYAIKEISKVTKISILNKDPNEQINRIQNEVDIMKTIIEHPKILKLHKVLNDPKVSKIFLILEYCSKSELKFGKSSNYPKDLLQAIIRDVVLGLEYLHGIGIIHRDIKPSNLLRNDENFIKISDFGISLNIKSSKENNSRSFGTPAFLAPELVSNSIKGTNLNTANGKADGMIDVWALGVSIYCLWFGELPFNGNNEYELFQEIINNEVDYERFNDSSKKDELLISLLKDLLQKDPKKRISIQDLKNHPYLLENLTNDEISQFQSFNQDYLVDRSNVNFMRNNSIQKKFRSIFKRKTSAASNTERPTFTLNPLDPTTTVEVSNLSPTVKDFSLPSSPSETSSASDSTDTSSSANTTAQVNNVFLSPRPPISTTTSSSTFSSRPLLTKKMATSSNSLNLNSLLRSKKDVPNYLDDSTFFQSLDSDESSSDESDDDEDSVDGLYNDDEDTLSFRIGPKRVASSLQMKTVNEYLDV